MKDAFIWNQLNLLRIITVVINFSKDVQITRTWLMREHSVEEFNFSGQSSATLREGDMMSGYKRVTHYDVVEDMNLLNIMYGVLRKHCEI